MKLFMVREPCNDVSYTLIKLFWEINIFMLYSVQIVKNCTIDYLVRNLIWNQRCM